MSKPTRQELVDCWRRCVGTNQHAGQTVQWQPFMVLAEPVIRTCVKAWAARYHVAYSEEAMPEARAEVFNMVRRWEPARGLEFSTFIDAAVHGCLTKWHNQQSSIVGYDSAREAARRYVERNYPQLSGAAKQTAIEERIAIMQQTAGSEASESHAVEIDAVDTTPDEIAADSFESAEGRTYSYWEANDTRGSQQTYGRNSPFETPGAPTRAENAEANRREHDAVQSVMEETARVVLYGPDHPERFTADGERIVDGATWPKGARKRQPWPLAGIADGVDDEARRAYFSRSKPNPRQASGITSERKYKAALRRATRAIDRFFQAMTPATGTISAGKRFYWRIREVWGEVMAANAAKKRGSQK